MGQDRKILKVLLVEKGFFLVKSDCMKKFILDCSSIAGMYNDSSINISYYNGDLEVQFTNSSGINTGKIRPSCQEYIKFGNNEQKAFEFNEENKEIVWDGPDADYKWIGGC